jgi:hypothetical protein
MPRVDKWEWKLLGNLAGSVQIDPDKCVLLVRSFDWHCQGPRENDNAYEAWVTNNWPNLVQQLADFARDQQGDGERLRLDRAKPRSEPFVVRARPSEAPLAATLQISS